MKVELVSITDEAERLIEQPVRISHKSEDNKIVGDLILKLINWKHYSPLEFGNACFYVGDISRVCLNQLVRHRLFSYVVKSQRYCDESNAEIIIPDNDILFVNDIFLKAEKQAQDNYKEAINNGLSKEDARLLLLEGTTTELYISGNFRQYRHFFELRLDKSAQWEIRDLASKMLEKLYQKCNSCFVDIYTNYMSEQDLNNDINNDEEYDI